MNSQKYSFTCTLSLGDIYPQVVAWLVVVFASLASALSLMSKPIYSLASVGIIVVVSLPFLLFGFVTTLFNHIEITAVTETERSVADRKYASNGPTPGSSIKAVA